MFSPAHPLQLALGLIIWSLYFVLVYSVLSVACAVAPPDTLDSRTWINLALLLITGVISIVLLLLAYRQWRAPIDSYGRFPGRYAGRFVARVAAGVYLAAAIATLAMGLPIAALPPCV